MVDWTLDTMAPTLCWFGGTTQWNPICAYYILHIFGFLEMNIYYYGTTAISFLITLQPFIFQYSSNPSFSTSILFIPPCFCRFCLPRCLLFFQPLSFHFPPLHPPCFCRFCLLRYLLLLFTPSWLTCHGSRQPLHGTFSVYPTIYISIHRRSPQLLPPYPSYHPLSRVFHPSPLQTTIHLLPFTFHYTRTVSGSTSTHSILPPSGSSLPPWAVNS